MTANRVHRDGVTMLLDAVRFARENRSADVSETIRRTEQSATHAPDRDVTVPLDGPHRTPAGDPDGAGPGATIPLGRG